MKWDQVTAATLAVLGILGCGRETTPTVVTDSTTTTITDPEIKGVIGYSAMTLTNPFFKVIADNMTEAAKQHGYTVQVLSAETDPVRQSSQIDNFIVQGVAAIVLNPCDSQALGPAIARANDAGIPVFTNDLAHAGDQGEVVCNIATDNRQGGVLAGEAMVKAIGAQGGEIAILGYPQAESCQQRVAGFKEVIDKHNAGAKDNTLAIVAELDGGGAFEVGANAAKDIIEANSNLSAIFAINDPSALGAYASLEAAGKEKQVTLIGFDGQSIGKEAIRDGKILCDPIQFPDKIGRITIEKIIAYFAGEDVEKEVLIPSALYYQADAIKELGAASDQPAEGEGSDSPQPAANE